MTHERYEDRVRVFGPAYGFPYQLWAETKCEEEENSYVVTGDSALQWTWHARLFLIWAEHRKRKVRIIALRRDKEATIDSFERWLGERRNHWHGHDGSYWEHHPWDKAFPTYVPDYEMPKRQQRRAAIERYYDEVQHQIDKLDQDERVLVVRTEELSEEPTILRITSHIGIENPVIQPVHENRGYRPV
jgi:hypothetical protein